MAAEPKFERSLKLDNRLQAARLTLPYQRAYFRETFSDELWQAMEHRRLTQAGFAEKAKVQKQFLTKVFRGANCTMDTIVNLAYALKYRAHIHLTPNEVACEWLHWAPKPTPLTNKINAIFFAGAAFSLVKTLEEEVECATVPPNP